MAADQLWARQPAGEKLSAEESSELWPAMQFHKISFVPAEIIAFISLSNFLASTSDKAIAAILFMKNQESPL